MGVGKETAVNMWGGGLVVVSLRLFLYLLYKWQQFSGGFHYHFSWYCTFVIERGEHERLCVKVDEEVMYCVYTVFIYIYIYIYVCVCMYVFPFLSCVYSLFTQCWRLWGVLWDQPDWVLPTIMMLNKKKEKKKEVCREWTDPIWYRVMCFLIYYNLFVFYYCDQTSLVLPGIYSFNSVTEFIVCVRKVYRFCYDTEMYIIGGFTWI